MCQVRRPEGYLAYLSAYWRDVTDVEARDQVACDGSEECGEGCSFWLSEIEADSEGKEAAGEVSCTPEGDSATRHWHAEVSGLARDAAYEFRVRARPAMGSSYAGPWSSSVSFQTLPEDAATGQALPARARSVRLRPRGRTAEENWVRGPRRPPVGARDEGNQEGGRSDAESTPDLPTDVAAHEGQSRESLFEDGGASGSSNSPDSRTAAAKAAAMVVQAAVSTAALTTAQSANTSIESASGTPAKVGSVIRRSRGVSKMVVHRTRPTRPPPGQRQLQRWRQWPL